MDCVLILFGRKLEPVKPDYEHQFLTPSWSESLKVSPMCILISMVMENIRKKLHLYFKFNAKYYLCMLFAGHG